LHFTSVVSLNLVYSRVSRVRQDDVVYVVCYLLPHYLYLFSKRDENYYKNIAGLIFMRRQ